MSGEKVAAKGKTGKQPQKHPKLVAAKKATTTKPARKGLKIPKGKKVALISVYNKTGIADFAQELIKMGWTILSSGGTAKALREAGLKVIDVAALVGGDAILGHRVVTLSREVHAGLLARHIPEDIQEMEKLGIPYIHMVVCDFYPMKDIIARPDATIESVVEMTDIGGPTMVRSAAKGNRIVICDAADRDWVLAHLQNLGNLTTDQLQLLRAKAEFTVARYCLNSAMYHGGPELYLGLTASKAKELAYAENKCQNPAHFFQDGSDDPLAINRFQVVSGHPSYTALADANGILEIICTLTQAFQLSKNKVPYIAIAGKHGNPCGAAIDWNDPWKALLNALCGDKVAVMGGEVITNFPITDELGKLLFQPPVGLDIGRDKWGLDLVMAQNFSNATVELLNKYEKRRLLANPYLLDPHLPLNQWVFKPIRGGLLRQQQYPFILSPKGIQEWVNDPLRGGDFDSLLIAWAICWKASSNTVALAKDNMLIGLGCGQQDRIACVQLCINRAIRAGHDTAGSVFASDAFFPFAESEQFLKNINPLISDLDNIINNLRMRDMPAKKN